MEKKSLAICIPHNYIAFSKEFVLSLLQLTETFHQSKWNDKVDIDILTVSGYGIDQMRERLAEEAIKSHDYLLWLDTDMTFPPNMIGQMLSYMERDDIEAVTGLYTFKTPPFTPHVYPKLSENVHRFHVGLAFPLDRSFPVEGAGFGCIMMKAEVFRRVDKPYFTWVVENGKIVTGEDLNFCKRAKMKMVCEPRLSCGHLRTTEYNIDTYLEYNQLLVKDGRIVVSKDRMKQIMGVFNKSKQ